MRYRGRRPVLRWCRIAAKFLFDGLYWTGVGFTGMVPPPVRDDDDPADPRYSPLEAELSYEEIIGLWRDEQSWRRR